jgi:glycosyltransferase involved in cell wall biosynthesis
MFVSIIIPTLNRSFFLDKTINSILSLNKNHRGYEIIIVDNGSSDDTKLICEKYTSAYQHVQYHLDSEPGLLTGRHRGAKEARGEILTFIDDDVLVSPTWLDTIKEVMDTGRGFSFLTGPSLPFYESFPPDWLTYFWSKNADGGKMCEWLSLLDLGSKPLTISPNYVWGLNFTVKKSVFLQLGGFHPDNIPFNYQMFQGDGETGLTLKAAAAGFKALYHPAAMIYHQVPTSRLSYEYFDKRAYYQGVCNSYTHLRALHINNGLAKSKSNNAQSLHRKIIAYSKQKAKKIFSGKSKFPGEIFMLRNRFAAKEKQGYDFHQKVFNEDPLVKQWVLRNNYFDYKLPKHD